MKSFISYGKPAHFIKNTLVLDGEVVGKFVGLKEAQEYCNSLHMSSVLVDELSSKDPVVLSEEKIAFTLAEQVEVRVTETMVNSFKNLLETRKFAPYNSLIALREQAKDLSQFPGKIEYEMNDGSKVLLDIETNLQLNKIVDLRESNDLIMFMTQTSANFVMCVELLIEDNNAN
jgi:hypothetical protein